MKPSVAIIGLIILIVVSLILIFCLVPDSDFEAGFWQADDSFCREAELDSFYLLIGEKNTGERASGERASYLLIQKDGLMLKNEPVNITMCRDWCIKRFAPMTLRSTIEGNISISAVKNADDDGDDDDDDDFVPKNMRFILHPMLGKLVLHRDDVVFAVLYKSSIASESLVTKIVEEVEDSEPLEPR